MNTFPLRQGWGTFGLVCSKQVQQISGERLKRFCGHTRASDIQPVCLFEFMIYFTLPLIRSERQRWWRRKNSVTWKQKCEYSLRTANTKGSSLQVHGCFVSCQSLSVFFHTQIIVLIEIISILLTEAALKSRRRRERKQLQSSPPTI